MICDLMSDFGEDFIRLLKLGDESAWEEAFQPLYAIACKTAYKFELLSGNETQDYAFEFLKKLPYKVLDWNVRTWEQLKANVVVSILEEGIVFLNDLAIDSFTRWKRMLKDNAQEAAEKLVVLLVAIREVISIKLNSFEKKLFKDHFLLKKNLVVLSFQYRMDERTIQNICGQIIKKLKDGLCDFGLGWVLEGGGE